MIGCPYVAGALVGLPGGNGCVAHGEAGCTNPNGCSRSSAAPVGRLRVRVTISMSRYGRYAREFCRLGFVAAISLALAACSLFKPDPVEVRYADQIQVSGYHEIGESWDHWTYFRGYLGPPDESLLSRISGPGLQLLRVEGGSSRYTTTVAFGKVSSADTDFNGCRVNIDVQRRDFPPSDEWKLSGAEVQAIGDGKLALVLVGVTCKS